MSEEGLTNRRPRPSDEEILATAHVGSDRKDIRVGAFVIFGLLAFMTVLFWMTDPGTFRGRYEIVTVVNDAGGVRAGDPIQMYGVNVGRVSGFQLVRPGEVHIELEIEGAWAIPQGSRARFGSAGIFGGRTMVIEPGAGPGLLAGGDTIPGSAPSGEGMLGSVQELSDQAGTVLTRIEALLDEETVGTVQGSARELEQLLADLSEITREQKGNIEELVSSLARSAEGIESAASAGPDVARAIARADSAMGVLAGTGASLDSAALSLRVVLDRMERGEGTLGRLSTDEALYENLTSAAARLDALLLDLQENPGRYINISIF